MSSNKEPSNNYTGKDNPGQVGWFMPTDNGGWKPVPGIPHITVPPDVWISPNYKGKNPIQK